ncbi:dynamin family protein [Ectobacillus polymachus]|uniref:dynamin family protein n=1 Tax=Ectobacillus polymachus TaxID=1508806 RepID=UPI003A852A57
MVQIASSQVHQMLYLYEMWKDKGDTENSKRIHDIIQKYVENEFMIAFCGHFSAGKSTMLNELYGKDLLPTSPIPTSANVVEIQRGHNRVVLTLKSGMKQSYEGTYTDEQLKQLFKNGEEVIGVHITREDASLPDGVILVDTPGIDSTDDAHKIATESALHVADVIFYMMDYNHVQSQVNLQFVKELKERNKTVYLVVNQIDKHKEEELSFPSYADSVKQSFLNWNIHVDGIFYTTLRNQNHPYNELKQLKQLLATIMEKRNEYLEESVRQEVTYLLHEHENKLRKTLENKGDVAAHSIEEKEQSLEKLYAQKEELLQKDETIKLQFSKELEHILQNAYLLPYEVRELAEKYLETELTNFKVGILFSKSKTEKEKEQRRTAFHEKISQTTETQLDVHVKQYLLTYLQSQDIYTEELGNIIYSITTTFTPSLLTDTIERGAGLSGNYVLTYTNDVAAAIKAIMRTKAISLFESIVPILKKKLEAELDEVNNHLRVHEKEYRDLTEGRDNWRIVTNYVQDLFNVWEGRKQIEPRSLDLLEEEEVTVLENPLFTQENNIVENDEVEIVEERIETKGTAEEQVRMITEHIREAGAILKPFSALRHLYEEIEEKRRRVETKQFTVALFGAFSAGKSSFANALLGAKVLPVSPNPTTAAINKIVPVTKEHPHETVTIKLKSESILLEDLQRIYKLFEKQAASLDEAIGGIDELLRHASPSTRQKTTLSFLRAVQAGYQTFKNKLGQMITTDMSEFSSFVANEEKSCFVEFMELHYDCELTRNGVTIVDTPGADSVNARHTDVSFQYIKNADAILFVTYYNHVFSRADREFLIQLGRVKDSFAMDKMFFMINAADLASTTEELQTVKDYIQGQLLQYGIRNPRLFPLSSLYALDEKLGTIKEEGTYGVLKQSGMKAFEEAFTTFIMRDLMLVSLTSLQSKIQSSHRFVTNILSNAKAGIEEKEIKRKQYNKEQEAIVQIISTYSVLTEEQALVQEIRELLFYVKQRVMLRYHDVFIEFINPGTLRSDKGDVKQILYNSVLELLDFLKNDFIQEMRATSLRVENWMSKKIQFSSEGLQKQCLQITENAPFTKTEEFVFSSATHLDPFRQLEMGQFKKAMSYYKNAKSFFEKNEKALMQEEMKQVLDGPMSAYVQEEEAIITEHYKKEWEKIWSSTKEKLQDDVLRYYQGIVAALSEHIDVSAYELAQKKLYDIMKLIENELNVL